MKGKSEIKIYDPTSGSGSLLINIGKCVAKYMGDSNKIKYYAQELKENTYNLTRMNLVMRGILTDNIVTRNGDTLEEDWPYFEESDPIGTYDPLYVDAVVSNPPYSQNWNPSNKEADPRYKSYGLAPKGKADYAFLLHDLYHIKPDGLMTIVLPHGVLFRGGEEGEIRKNLIENNKIDTIIGLPANIFFGTGIPTIIMGLKQRRSNTDVLIIDASKGFEKVGKNNKLRACDIKRIVDAVISRSTIEKFSKVVSRDDIRANDYNLNIPRYVDSSEKPESWDVYASMFGGIPESELEDYARYWCAFPGLKDSLFTKINESYWAVKPENIKEEVFAHKSVSSYIETFNRAFSGFDSYLKTELIEKMESLNASKEESVLSDSIFSRLSGVALIDRYEAYQLLDNEWSKIAVDLEMIQTEGFSATTQVDPNMVVKKKDGKEVEVQEGFVGHILPFDLVQQKLLPDKLAEVKAIEDRLVEISSQYEELIDLLDEDNKQKLLNDDNDAFVAKEVSAAAKEIWDEISTEEISALSEYLDISKKKDKITYISLHPNIKWDAIGLSDDGTCAAKTVKQYITAVRKAYSFAENSIEYAIVSAVGLMEEEKELKKLQKEKANALHVKTKETIEGLTKDQVLDLLYDKWIVPILFGMTKLPENLIYELVSKLERLSAKYETTLHDVEKQIEETEADLVGMIDLLTGNSFDMSGLKELKKLLGGE